MADRADGSNKCLFAEFVTRRPWAIIAGTAVITAFFASQIPRLGIDNDVERFFPANHRVRAATGEIEAVFGSLDSILLMAQARRGVVLTTEGIEEVRRLTEAVRELPGVKAVASLTTVDHATGSPEGLTVVPLAGRGDSPEVVKSRLVDWEDAYRGTVISADFRSTALAIDLDDDLSPEEGNRLHDELATLVAGGRGELELRLAGLPLVQYATTEYIRADLVTLLPVVVAVVLALLFLSFRRPAGILLPLGAVAVSAVWTVGFMAAAGIPLDIVSTAIPVLLVAVGSAYGIHVYSAAREDNAGGADPRDAAGRAISTVGGPVLLAGLTTAGGFLSIAFGPIMPLRSFALVSAGGVLLAMGLSLTVVPAVLALLPAPRTRRNRDRGHRTPSFLAHLRGFTARPPYAIVLAVTVAIGLGIGGARRLDTESNPVEFFREDSEIRRATAFAQENFSGTDVISVMVTGPQPGSLSSPEVLQVIDDLAAYLQARHPQVARVTSVATFVRRMNKVMNVPAGGDAGAMSTSDLAAVLSEARARARGMDLSASDLVTMLARKLNWEGEAYNEIPTDPGRYAATGVAELGYLISQYLLLYSGNLDRFIDDPIEPKRAHVMVHVADSSTRVLAAVGGDIETYMSRYLPAGYEFRVGGRSALVVALSEQVTRSQTVSMIAAAVLVFLIVAIAYRSPAAGVIGLFPLGVTVLVDFAVMGFGGIPLDIATSMITSIAFGIGVDYTIHFLSACRRECVRAEDLRQAIARALESAGRPIMAGAMSVGAGFGVLLLSHFAPLRNLGVVVCVTMVASALASLTVLPVALVLVNPRFLRRALPARGPNGDPQARRAAVASRRPQAAAGRTAGVRPPGASQATPHRSTAAHSAESRP